MFVIIKSEEGKKLKFVRNKDDNSFHLDGVDKKINYEFLLKAFSVEDGGYSKYSGYNLISRQNVVFIPIKNIGKPSRIELKHLHIGMYSLTFKWDRLGGLIFGQLVGFQLDE